MTKLGQSPRNINFKAATFCAKSKAKIIIDRLELLGLAWLGLAWPGLLTEDENLCLVLLSKGRNATYHGVNPCRNNLK